MTVTPAPSATSSAAPASPTSEPSRTPSPTRAPSATPYPTLARVLSLASPHMNGPDVTALQARLLELGYSEVVVADGDFGALTDQAVRRFQQEHGLVVDGIVGPQTWGALFETQGAPPGTPRSLASPTAGKTPTFQRMLKARLPNPMSGDDVDAVYARLAALGDFQNCRGQQYMALEYDLSFANRVREFQQRHGLPVTGEVDQATWEALFSPQAQAAPARVWTPPALGPAPAPPQRGLLASTVGWVATGDIVFNIQLWDLTTGKAGKAAAPLDQNYTSAWSPDGARLAFFSLYDGAPEVFVINADGSGLTQVTCGAVIMNAYAEGDLPGADLDWSPDGTRLAYTGEYGVYIVALDGSGGVQQVSNQRRAGSLAWSPDGTRLATTTAGLLEVVNLDGTGGYPVPSIEAAGADWSPDSAWLVVADGYNLWRMTPQGTEAVKLTSFTDSPMVQNPAWSPDGGRIAFEYYGHQGAYFQIGIVNADGTGLVLLPGSTSALYTQPDWQP